MGALIIVMLWLGINIAIEILYEDKKKQLRKKSVKKVQRRNYDFDILSYDEPEYTQLKKSA